MRKVFEKFALEEQEHKRKLEAVKAGKVDIGNDEIGSLGIAEGVQDVEPRPDMSYVQFLEFAMKKEKTSFRLYNNLASMTKKKELRDIFMKLAQEEAEHKLRFEIEYDLRTF
jgi:rubrerythrin